MKKNKIKINIFFLILNIIFIILLIMNYKFIIHNLIIYISICTLIVFIGLIIILFLFDKNIKFLQKRFLYILLFINFCLASLFIFIFCNLIQDQTLIFSSDLMTIYRIWTDQELEVFMLNYTLDKNINLNPEIGTQILTTNKTPEDIKSAVDFIESEQNKLKKNEEFSYIKYITDFCKRHIIAIAVIGTLSSIGLLYYFGVFDSFFTVIVPATVSEVLTQDAVLEQFRVNILCPEAERKPLTNEAKVLLAEVFKKYKPLETIIQVHMQNGTEPFFKDSEAELVMKMEDIKEDIRQLITQARGAFAAAKAAGKHLPLGISENVLNYYIRETDIDNIRNFLFKVEALPLPVKITPIEVISDITNNVNSKLSSKSVARLLREGITEEMYWKLFYPKGLSPMEAAKSVANARYEEGFKDMLDASLNKKK